MSMQTRTASASGGLFSVVLPGSWASIPVADLDAAEKRVSALVKQQVGTNDRLAGRRRQVREELMTTVRQAAEEGAIAFSLALELLPGIPFSGAIMSRVESWPSGTPADKPATERLTAAFPGAVVIETSAGPAARRAGTSTQKYVTTQTPALSLDYWLPIPETDRLLATTVSLPIAPDADLFTELFDSIIDSIMWTGAPAQPGETEDGQVEDRQVDAVL